MSIIEENSQIPMMYQIRHKHDTIEHEDFPFDYKDKLFSKSISRFIRMNDKVRIFTDKLSKIFAVMMEETHTIKNQMFYTHKKYYNKNAR